MRRGRRCIGASTGREQVSEGDGGRWAGLVGPRPVRGIPPFLFRISLFLFTSVFYLVDPPIDFCKIQNQF